MYQTITNVNIAFLCVVFQNTVHFQNMITKILSLIESSCKTLILGFTRVNSIKIQLEIKIKIIKIS